MKNEKAIKYDIDAIEPKLTSNALKVIQKRYLLKDENGIASENPKGMFRRVAHHLASIDKNYGAKKVEVEELEYKFLKMMANMEFLPNSPTFTGAGTKLGQLSACFVLPIEDDMKSILMTQMHMGLIHKSGGGTGFTFSKLRPANDIVGSTGGVSCGPIGFMQMYNDTTEQIKQGGTRRGANMGILRIDHPDILEFIDYKEKEGILSNFNISVEITDDFMQKVESDQDYKLVNPRNGKITKTLNAAEVFKKIVEAAWRNGEPGIIFIDEINRHNPTPQLGDIEATNPCGEQPLLPYESCNLGSINLAVMTKYVGDKAEIDWEKLDRTTELAVHLMDNVVDANRYPLPEIKKMTKDGNRKLGLGVMGFADLLMQVGVGYNTPEGYELGEKIMKRIRDKAYEADQKLARVRGVFKNWKGSIWEKRGLKMHNASLTTIAPTGTLSMMASCSSGIEPTFALVYTKTVIDGTPFVEVNKYFEKVARDRGFYSKELMEEISKTRSIQKFSQIPDDVKGVFVTAADISPEEHVKMQAIFQKYTDNAISKTINFPNQATKKDVEKAYLLAYKLKCKGITIYRDGSRIKQILTTGDGSKEVQKEPEFNQYTSKITPRKRPEVISGSTYKVKTAYGNLYITINEDEKGEPFEVFTSMGKSGGFFSAKAEAISRLISLALRSGIDVKEVIDQLKGIRGPAPIWGENGVVLSMPDAIAQVLQRHVESIQQRLNLNFTKNQALLKQPQPKPSSNNKIKLNLSIADYGEAPACPECGGLLEMGEGCMKCNHCGYTKCM